MAEVRDIDLTEPGFVIVHRAAGPPVKYPLADLLRAADIPTGLTHAQVAGLSTLANVFVILIRTLIARDVIDETFADSAGLSSSLNQLIYVIEQLGGAYHQPDFGDVEGV